MTPIVQRTNAIPQQGRLVLSAAGHAPCEVDADTYVIVEAEALSGWARRRWLVMWCRGCVCHHRKGRPACAGHPDWSPAMGALIGDRAVIGSRSAGARAVYIVTGRNEWSAYRMERES